MLADLMAPASDVVFEPSPVSSSAAGPGLTTACGFAVAPGVMARWQGWGLVFALLAPSWACGLTLAPVFREGAVLQRDRALPVWGQASAGESVVVEFGGQRVETVAGPDGRWRAVLAPMPADGRSRDLVATGAETVVVRDVVVGEVWLVSGQSNMEWPLRYSKDRDVEILAARWPLIREFKVERQASDIPRTDVAGEWRAATPNRVAEFSGVAYAFARDLHAVLGVPVGIINCTYGGTPIEPWLPPDTIHSPRPADEAAHAPGALFHGMIAPLSPFGVRGFLWYQGEANANRRRAHEYAPLFQALIRTWRAHFGVEEAPFYWAQLAPFRRADIASDEWARLREAQAAALALPHTGQAITLDVGDVNDIHPKDKATVGRRLARLALRRTYGFEVLDRGPVMTRVVREADGFRVYFENATGGLRTTAGAIRGFEVAGSDRVFHLAEAKAEDDTVWVRSAQVPEPVALRYAWRNDPEATLINRPGLPAEPFRTDDWPARGEP